MARPFRSKRPPPLVARSSLLVAMFADDRISAEATSKLGPYQRNRRDNGDSLNSARGLHRSPGTHADHLFDLRLFIREFVERCETFRRKSELLFTLVERIAWIG